MKAGTVSLSRYLDDHPDAFLGRGGTFGEPNFFVSEFNWSRGLDWYESLPNIVSWTCGQIKCNALYLKFDFEYN